MSIVVIGVNHRTGPLSLLERLAIRPDAQGKAIGGLVGRHSIREAVVLSTCNRTEIYAVAERFHGAYADIRDFLCDLADLGPDELHPHLYSQHDDAAVTHLFEVAAGLDSAVLGESEILGQVRSAWQLAQEEGGAKATLNLLFRHAIETGKRARTETSIGRGTASAVVVIVVEQDRATRADTVGHAFETIGNRIVPVAVDMNEGDPLDGGVRQRLLEQPLVQADHGVVDFEAESAE